VLVVMELHGRFVDVGLESGVVVGKRGKFVCHFFLLCVPGRPDGGSRPGVQIVQMPSAAGAMQWGHSRLPGERKKDV